jgi:hypothetical protein
MPTLSTTMMKSLHSSVCLQADGHSTSRMPFAGAIACTTAAVLLPQDLTVRIFGMAVDHKYLWLCFALALWGLGQGAGPVVEALLADSTRTGACCSVIHFHHKVPSCYTNNHRVQKGCPLHIQEHSTASCRLENDCQSIHVSCIMLTMKRLYLQIRCPFSAGSRSKVYSIMFSAGLAGMSIGPCAAAATFAITGNAWHVQTLQHVILVGMVLAVIPILALLCFDDDHSLGAESNAVRHQPTPTRSPVSGVPQYHQHHHLRAL